MIFSFSVFLALCGKMHPVPNGHISLVQGEVYCSSALCLFFCLFPCPFHLQNIKEHSTQTIKYLILHDLETNNKDKHRLPWFRNKQGRQTLTSITCRSIVLNKSKIQNHAHNRQHDHNNWSTDHQTFLARLHWVWIWFFYFQWNKLWVFHCWRVLVFYIECNFLRKIDFCSACLIYYHYLYCVSKKSMCEYFIRYMNNAIVHCC